MQDTFTKLVQHGVVKFKGLDNYLPTQSTSTQGLFNFLPGLIFKQIGVLERAKAKLNRFKSTLY